MRYLWSELALGSSLEHSETLIPLARLPVATVQALSRGSNLFHVFALSPLGWPGLGPIGVAETENVYGALYNRTSGIVAYIYASIYAQMPARGPVWPMEICQLPAAA